MPWRCSFGPRSALMDKNWGVWSTAALLEAGKTASQIRSAVAHKRLRRLRRGWFAVAGAVESVVGAVEAGGTASCVTALRLYGVWVPEGAGSTHIRFRRRGRSGCLPYGHNPPLVASVDDLSTAVRCAARCVDAETLVVLLDSIMHLGLASYEQLEAILMPTPARIRALLRKTDRAEAGTETMSRLRLRRAGIRVRTQVQLTPDHRVDLLIGDRLVVECDSREFHSSWEQQTKDRKRDRELMALGYLVIRLTYHQVCFGWEAAFQDILAIVRAGRHVWPRKR